MTVGMFREFRKMGLRKGDIIRTKHDAIEGIIVGFETAEYNSYYHKVQIFVTYNRHNAQSVGTIIKLNTDTVVRGRK